MEEGTKIQGIEAEDRKTGGGGKEPLELLVYPNQTYVRLWTYRTEIEKTCAMLTNKVVAIFQSIN